MKVRLVISVLLVVFNITLTYAGIPPQKPDKRMEELAKERGKLEREKDPVDRTRSHIKITDILLTLIGDAVRSEDFAQAEQLLADYTNNIQSAHRTMMETGRDANDKPKGFKDLEIALRRQVRVLEDLGGTVTFDRREPIEKAIGDASVIRDELIDALFGVQSATSGS